MSAVRRDRVQLELTMTEDGVGRMMEAARAWSTASVRGSRWFDRGYTALAESLCPLVILAILIDCTRWVGWVDYQRDPSIYASIARFWQDGLIPYRDVWEFKPPLIFVALRAGFALWGYEPESLRRIFMILITVGALTLYAGLRYARCLIAAPVAALGLMTLVVVNPWGLPWQNTETIVAALGAAAMGCAAMHQRSARWWWAGLTGACLALATLGKQPAALFSIALGLQLCLWGAPAGWGQRMWYVLTRGLLGLSGFAIVVGTFALYFAAHGAATAFYNAILVDGARYSGDFSLAVFRPAMLQSLLWPRTPGLARNVLAFRGMWPFVGAVGALTLLTFVCPSRWTATAWVWLLAAAIAVLAGPCGENHYLVMTLPALTLTAGIGCEVVWCGVVGAGRPRDGTKLLSGLALAGLLYGFSWDTLYLPERNRQPGISDLETQARTVGEQIHRAARPGDTLLVEDTPIQIYLYAGVPPASRFIYWNAPHPSVDAEREAAIKQKAAFLFLTPATAEQMRTLGSTHPWAPIVAARYEEWSKSKLGTLYRRRAGN